MYRCTGGQVAVIYNISIPVSECEQEPARTQIANLVVAMVRHVATAFTR